MLQHFYKAQ